MKNKLDSERAYEKATAEVRGLLTDGETMLAGHALRQQADPTNWGFAGDMQQYAEKLKSILGRESQLYSVPDGRGGMVRVTVPQEEK